MSLRTNIPDPDEMNDERAAWAELGLREFAYEVSGPQAMADTNNLDHVAIDFLCDLAHLADERGWRVIDLLRVARARYDLNTEGQGEQFDGFEELVPPSSDSPKKPMQTASIQEEDERKIS